MSEIWRRKWEPEDPPPPSPFSPRPQQPLPLKSSPAPEPPRWPPRFSPGCGWKLERKPESCLLRRPSFPQPWARARSVVGKPLPGALQALSSLTRKKFAWNGAGLLHLLREVAGGRQRREPHLVWQQPRRREKLLKGPFPSSARGNLFLLQRGENPGSLNSSLFRHLSMSNSKTDRQSH